jgi:hypothetical protein
MENQNKFVIVADNEVIMHFIVHKHEDGATDGILAGLRSEPKIIELTEKSDPSVTFGWKHVNGDFVPPEQTASVTDDYEVD